MVETCKKCLTSASLLICLAAFSATGADAAVLLDENFDGLPYGPTVERQATTELGMGNVWTKTAPAGWTIDDSQMPGTLGGPDDGTREYYGWNFMQQELFIAAGQDREQFTLASGGVAVADPDEWDDDVNPEAFFNSFLKTPTVQLNGARAVIVRFDSSWRPEGFDDIGGSNNQTATIGANFGVGGGQTTIEALRWDIEALRWDSDPTGAFFKADAQNEQVSISLIAPSGADSLSLNFGMTEAYNDWWWAIDNLKVETFNPVALEVDVSTGVARIVGTADSAVPRDMFSYEISSPSSSLNAAAWEAGNLDAQGIGSGSGPGDFNADGVVDAADYTVWRDGGASTTGPAGYSLWADNYGATNSGAGSDWDTVISQSNLLSEAVLIGEEILDENFSVSLGSAFAVGGAQDLKFEYAGPDGTITEGLVVYINSATSSGVSVPEPTTWSLGVIIMGLIFGTTRKGLSRSARQAVALGCFAALAAAPTAEAAYTLDRSYRFGENDSTTNGPATIGTKVSANGRANSTDSAGTPASAGGVREVIALAPVVNSPALSPTYVNVGTGTLARPFAPSNAIGAQFTNTTGADTLFTYPLGSPGESISSSTATTSIYPEGLVGPYDYEGVTNRGMQFWTRPSRVNTNQVIVYDTDQHVVGISSNGRWFMQYDYARAPGRTVYGAVNDLVVDTSVPQSLAQANQWYHVMLVRPYGAFRKVEDPVNPADPLTFDGDVSNGPNGGARLYINGVAVAAEGGGFDTSLSYNFGTGSFRGDSLLSVGGFQATPASGARGAVSQPYVGIVDDLEMFVTGTSFNGTEWGNFNLATDNGFIANTLSGKGAADLNLDGFEDINDVNAFVAGWLSKNTVNGIVVGDLRSRANGDVNFDGQVDLLDWREINLASPASGTLIGQALGFISVPEPTTATLIAVGLMGLLRRRN